jgi:hypothetical protein
MPDVDLIEQANSQSPTTAGFGMGSGRGMWPLWCDDHDRLQDAIIAVVGDVRPAGDGRLERKLPLENPVYSWLTGVRVAQIQGRGKPGVTASDGNNFTGNRFDSTARYPAYLLSCEFDQKRYNSLLPDSAISVVSAETRPNGWWDADGTQRFDKGSTEYKRFCFFDPQPDPQLITAQQGLQYLVRDNTPITTAGGGVITAAAPHGYSFSGAPRLWIDQTDLTVTWFWVPTSYWTSINSRLRKYAQRVNQFSIWGYDPGMVLYVGAKPEYFPPPVPETTPLDPTGIFSVEQLMNVAMRFKVREQRSSGTLANDKNKVWEAGHNCEVTFFDRKFYPTIFPNPATPNDSTKWVPKHDSFPIDLLFGDPDVA